MMLPSNPYIAGNPVGNSTAFVGREDVLRAVLRVLRDDHQNAITLYGQRRIGKTSILQYLTARLPQEGPYVAVYFDLQDRAAKPLGTVLAELARTVADHLHLPAPDLGKEPERTFRERWLPEALARLPEGHSLVLLFDEFDTLADPEQGQAAEAFFPYLRDLMARDIARLQFVFVLGRNIGDLSQIALSLFKGVYSKRVSLLSRQETEALIRLAERNQTLRWSAASIKRVWALTHGHPYLTQALCWEVWDRLYEEEPDGVPKVRPKDVEAAIPPTLEKSRNALEWLWQGLGPAEKVVAAALAQAGEGPVTEAELERILRESGVRIVIRELQDAPRLLQEWDLLEPADGGYRFRVELLRRWIAGHYPLRAVQEELDRIEPVAENLYQAAQGFYMRGDLKRSADLLEQALETNPNHRRAAEMLSTLYLRQGELDKAQAILERLVEIFPRMARPRLIQLYLRRAEEAVEEDEKLRWYERVLALSPDNVEALAGLRPLQHKAQLERNYQEALVALQKGKREKARRLLLAVLNEEPGYKEATRYLHLAVTGEDPQALREKVQAVEVIDHHAESSPSETEQAGRPQERSNPSSEIMKRWWEKASSLQIRLAIGTLLMLACIAFGPVGYALFSQRYAAETTSSATSTLRPTPLPLLTATPTPTPIPAGAIRTSEKDWMIMHYVPAGEFTMGSDWDEIKNYPLAHEFRNEVPKHQVYLDAFWVDQTEVTNAQYGKCVEEGGCTPSGCSDNPAFNQPNQPVVCVTREQAIAYCHWAGRELPTEAQWEKAARGTDGRLYPWGNIPQPSCDYAVMNDGGLSCGHGETTWPVGSKPIGASPYGALDMAGNVWEWVSDWYDPDYYSNSPYENPKGPDAPVDDHLGVRRGGSFNRDQPSQLRVAIRYWQDVDTSNKTSLGFRCVLPDVP